jgi:hypothetical protein
MEVYKTEITSREVLDDVTCDSCGKSCKTIHGSFEYMTLDAIWGYGTKKDMEKWEAQICEQCVDEKMKFIVFEKTELKSI